MTPTQPRDLLAELHASLIEARAHRLAKVRDMLHDANEEPSDD